MSASHPFVLLALVALASRAHSEPGAPAANMPASVRPVLARVGTSDVRGRVDVVPAESEIGEPVMWILGVEHDQDAVVRATTPELGLDWILLEDQRVVRTLDAAGGRTRTEITWRVAGLEPGERALPPITIEVEEDGTQRTLTTGVAAAQDAMATEIPAADATAPAIESATLVVRSALAPDENAPRPQRGFLPPPPGAEGRRIWPWVAGALALAAIFVVVKLRARRRSAPVAAPTPLEALALLERRLAEEPDAGRALVYDASRLLRDAVDAALGAPRAAATDEGWARAIEADERLPLGVRTASARILASAERTKYALEVPTRFALAELLGDVRNVLGALAEARIKPTEDGAHERRGAAA